MPNSYLTWIEANDKFSKCMAGQDAAAYEKMSADQKAQICVSEANAVKSMLDTDKVSFRNLLAERMAAVNQQWTHYLVRYYKNGRLEIDGKEIEELGIGKAKWRLI